MSGRCTQHLYALNPVIGLRICMRCAKVEPPRGIVTDKHTYEHDMGREPVPGALSFPLATRESLMRRIDAMLGPDDDGA